MDNVSTEENKNVVANTLPELPSNMSKRQLKKMQKKEKWLERKIEKRLESLAAHSKFYKLWQLYRIFHVFKLPENKSYC